MLNGMESPFILRFLCNFTLKSLCVFIILLFLCSTNTIEELNRITEHTTNMLTLSKKLGEALWPEDEDENPLFGELLVESDEEDEA